MSNLDGKKALVCGASQGIGRAIAQSLADKGATLILVSRNEKALIEVKKSLKDSDRHQTVALDLGDLKAAEQFAVQLSKQMPEVSLVVLNSGGPKGGPLIDAAALELESAFRQHVLSSQILLKAIVPGMKKNNYGRIISILSTSVKMPIVGLGVSNTIRGAMASYMKTLSLELGPFGITANNILPGFTKTARLDALKAAGAERAQKAPEDIEQEWLNAIPLRRFVEPQETAQAALFLMESDSISGVSLAVDGGRIGAL